MIVTRWPLVLLLSAGVMLGTLIGVPILGHLPPTAYWRGVGSLLVLLGASLLLT